MDGIVLDHDVAVRLGTRTWASWTCCLHMPITHRHIADGVIHERCAQHSTSLADKKARTEHHPDRYPGRDGFRKFLLHQRKTSYPRYAVLHRRLRLHTQRSLCFAPPPDILLFISFRMFLWGLGTFRRDPERADPSCLTQPLLPDLDE